MFDKAEKMSIKKARIFGRQLVAARGLLDMTQAELAAIVETPAQHLAKIEAGTVIARPSTITKLREAIESRGVEFTNGESPGVRLKSERQIEG